MSSWSDHDVSRIGYPRPVMAEHETPRIPGPMSRDDLGELTTWLYRMKGECFRRGVDTVVVSAALGQALAFLSTVQDERRITL